MEQQELGCLWVHSFSEPFFSHHSLPRGTAFMGTLPVSSSLESLPAPGRASVKMICWRLAHSLLLSISLLFYLSLRPSRKTKLQMETQKVPLLSHSGKRSFLETLRSFWSACDIPFIIHGVTLCHSEVGRLLGSSLTVNEEM